MIVITGASGFVGRHLLHGFRCLSSMETAISALLPLSHNGSVSSGIRMDLSDASAVQDFFNTHDVTGVIHLAAEARPAVCESDPALAHSGNVRLTENLLTACKTKRPYFLHVSTDMVFRGNRGDYSESDHPDATSVYGRTKAQGESLVQQYDGPWCIMRPSLVYGSPIGGKVSSLSWTLNTLKSASGHFFSDEIRTPVWVDDLVALVIALTKVQATGIVHAGGPQRLSRLEFAQITAGIWGFSESQIRSKSLGADPVNAWRPRDVSLKSELASALHNFADVPTALQLIRKRSLVETEIIHRAPPVGIR